MNTITLVLGVIFGLLVVAQDPPPGERGGPIGDGLVVPPVPPPTWNGEVADIIERRCVSCHASGRVGPFELVDAAGVRNRGRFLLEVIDSGRMPPWLPTGTAWANHRTVTAAERATLSAWLESGGLVGDGPARVLAAPGPPAFRSDVVLEMPKAHAIPEESDPAWHTGEIDVHGVTFSLENPGPLRVQAIRHRPASPQAMRVAAFAFDDTGAGRYLDERDPRVGFLMGGDPGIKPMGADGVILAGSGDFRLPVGFHVPVPVASDLVTQFQYRPTGVPERLQERIELELVPSEEASRPIRWLPLAFGRVDLPAGVEQRVSSAPIVLEHPLELLGISPRAIEICKSVHVMVEFPDGRRRVLVDIPDWDHHQRETLRFEPPVTLPVGCRLQAVFDLDNTAANPRNPDDPPRRVNRGRRTGLLGVILHVAARTAAGDRYLGKAGPEQIRGLMRRGRPSPGTLLESESAD
ncbi:MAG: cytochrome c [Phycisphaerales bacterium]|nr:cytochrome c [Phycisphaerales bacterium]